MDEKRKILITDDDPDARSAFGALLSREGYEIMFAENGTKSLAMAEKSPPDLIILDLMMPDMDGFEVCRRLKSDEKLKHIPIIIVTALDCKETMVRGLDEGADEFLAKPVTGYELRARVRSMLRIKKLYDELWELMKIREDLVDMIVHDMANPLCGIMAFGKVLSKKITHPEDVFCLDRILLLSEQLNSMLNDMLMTMKMKSEKAFLNKVETDINGLILEVEKNYYQMARTKGIKLITKLPQNNQPVYIDLNLFQRVLDNLISNAIKYSPQNSTVTVLLEHNDSQSDVSQTVIRVFDEGPGLPQEFIDRIFDKFEVVDIEQKDIPQFGLGLFFCKTIIEAHGGRIYAGPNFPRGSVFTVEI